MLQYCVAGFDLVAQYFGAMVSAYNKSKQGAANAEKVKLFLTPLGGGVFQNPREMIASSVLLAYYQAQELLTNFDDNVQVIFLAWDGKQRQRNFPHECSDFSEFFNHDSGDTTTLSVIQQGKKNLIVNKKVKKALEEIQQEEADRSAQPPADYQEQPDEANIKENVTPLQSEEEPRTNTMLGDELFKKFKEGSLTEDDKEAYRKMVLSNFDSKQQEYDETFKNTDTNASHNEKEYNINVVVRKLRSDQSLVDNLFELFLIQKKKNTFNKLLFINEIFRKIFFTKY